jgi:sugar O-acyltransferase (sialic acid O-acetyltransferase NeuD family)
MIRSEILVPLLNANEPEARLAAIHVQDGQAVERGTLLFTIETTKAASDIEAPEPGFVRILAAEGAMLAVGDRIAVIAEAADEPVETPKAREESASAGLRMTRPARELVESLGLDLAKLPTGKLVTEADVRALAGAIGKVELPASEKPYLLVFGGGGHAKAVMDLVKQAGEFAVVGIVDDKIAAGTQVMGIPVLGSRAILPALAAAGVRLAANGVGGILDIQVRVRVFELLGSSGFAFPSLIHPRAALEPSATVGEGAQIFANAYIGSEAVLAPRCMINTNAVVSHDCAIGAYSHIAPGALLAGHVQVGERSLVGMGVTTAIGVRIGSGVRIGNGAIILADVPDGMVVQAGRFWTGKETKPDSTRA